MTKSSASNPPSAVMGKRRLAVVGATYATEEPRKKILSLAEHFELTCITADAYTGYGLINRLADQPKPTTYQLVGLPPVGNPSSTTRYFLRGVGEALRHAQPEIVLVETEPWAWLRWQTWWATRRLGGRVQFGEFSWENVRRTGWKSKLLAMVYRAAAWTVDFVIGGNEEAGTFFVEAGLPRERLLVSPQLGVDEGVFHPADAARKKRCRDDLRFPGDAFLVGFSGRLLELKGVPDLIEAVERVRAQPGGEKVQLVLLGPGEVAPLLRRHGSPPEWLHVRPACTHAEMARFMQSLDLFVLPSRDWNQSGHQWREQFGHVLIEAMACGVPVVGSSSGAIPSVLANPEQIFPQGDVDQLTKRMATFVHDDSLRAKTIQRQNARLRANYTNSKLAHIWAKFIQRVAAEAKD